jgi:hypothetical protein
MSNAREIVWAFLIYKKVTFIFWKALLLMKFPLPTHWKAWAQHAKLNAVN